ncbi:lipopolysaccharide export system permease protein [Rubricella aquisinus]|uniref:Lipopolysaccharide export system permease protein n=1 Tax=Rubricella aquisinus TaxID=2028108 RepID=A0A840WUP2_9RHOB|nr:LPS export ABC transporter permease LptG [Rubricella aquisinus]MBB5514930.1 lipopolysaccharide export system permease protein [Rubricella aquisinus]
MAFTLWAYLGRRFLMSVMVTFFATFCVVVMGDLLELTREAAARGRDDVPVISMALLHAPSVLNKGLTFVLLIGSLVAFLRFARTSELVVLRAAGVSVWRILLAPLVLAVLLGFGTFTIYNPLSAAALKQYDRLDVKYLSGSDTLLTLAGDGLWLRQTNDAGQTVINAARTNGDGSQLIGVTFFEFRNDGTLARRIEGPNAELSEGAWVLPTAVVWNITTDPDDQTSIEQQRIEALAIPTDLTSERIVESFADPRALSFWDLQDFIETMESAGLSAVRHRLYLQTEFAKPLLFVAVVLIGAAFSMRHVRFGNTGQMVLACITTGFALFFLSDVTQALGSSGAIPILIAAWVPPVAALSFGAGLLLILEDG